MTWIIITGCLLPVGMAALWFSPMRVHLLHALSVFDRFKFTCRVEQFSDESQPVDEDQFFRIDMIGRIPTPEDNVDTDVRLEIVDITDGHNHPHQVFSVDEQYRHEDSAEFYYQKRNGIVPQKNSILARWVTVTQFPCHTLRFAYRGRRKLLFRVAIIDIKSGCELSVGCRALEYVCCHDGYREVHGRRRDVLKASLELSAATLATATLSDDITAFWSKWIKQKAEMFLSADEALEMIHSVENELSMLSIKRSSEMIMGYGQNADRFSAMEMALQTAALGGKVTRQNFDNLILAAQELEIKQDRFFETAQKILLSSNCQFEDLSRLFGLSTDMDEESFRKRLNEEYRKWNARVTHPDAQIRCQADQMLTLIAEIRSQQLRSCSCE